MMKILKNRKIRAAKKQISNFTEVTDFFSEKSESGEKKNQALDNKNNSSQHNEFYDKRVYDLEQLLDIAMSFCQNLDFDNLLESIVYICMAQLHTLGAQIFVRDLIKNENFILESSKDKKEKTETMISVRSPIAIELQDLKKPISYDELNSRITDHTDLEKLSKFNPTLFVPLLQKNHLNGILILQERIAIDDDTSYTEYEQNQIMSIANLASVAINNASLLEKSSTDMMTHLKLKYYFFSVLAESLDAAFTTKGNISVLMFDIDFFKKFNDTYGHECGDFVLIGVADLIKQCLRDTDVASRYGGEEFTVLLNNTGKDEALMVAERIRSTIDNHEFIFDDKHLHVTISVGVSTYDIEKNPINSPNGFVNQADTALYKSKEAGRNRVTFFCAEK